MTEMSASTRNRVENIILVLIMSAITILPVLYRVLNGPFFETNTITTALSNPYIAIFVTALALVTVVEFVLSISAVIIIPKQVDKRLQKKYSLAATIGLCSFICSFGLAVLLGFQLEHASEIINTLADLIQSKPEITSLF